MLRSLALTSSVVLSLFCAACDPDAADSNNDDNNNDSVKDTRSSVTGSHPVNLTITTPGAPEEPEPLATNLNVTADANSRDTVRLNIPFICDLTAKMTGATTFEVVPGSTCAPTFPGRDNTCTFTYTVLQGSGGRATTEAPVGLELSMNLTVACEGEEPFTGPISMKMVGR